VAPCGLLAPQRRQLFGFRLPHAVAMSAYVTDTIAAISTPLGEGALGIVRLSGPDAIRVAGELFHPSSGSHLSQLAARTLHLGRIVEPSTGDVVDTCTALVYRAPRSYTGEDMVELTCHGGAVLLRRVLSLLVAQGARLAEPGEFTKRAFLNGKMDLSQAEAVIDAIRAQTPEALKVAAAQLAGRLSETLRPIRSVLLEMLAAIEASIDFPDDVDEPSREWLASQIADAMAQIDEMLATADVGRVYREGVAVVLVGRPNVGKSSLLNALLRDVRAIVTAVPGTTRDVIEEAMNLKGLPIRLLDTAGLRPAMDPVEVIGVERTRASLRDADLVVMVMDRSDPLSPADKAVWREANKPHVVVAANKSDLTHAWSLQELRDYLHLPSTVRVVETCAKTQQGVPELEDAMFATILGDGGRAVSAGHMPMLSNVRHRTALEAAKSSLKEALNTLEEGMPFDLLAIDLRAAAEALSRVTGESVSAEVVDAIFSRFCVGK